MTVPSVEPDLPAPEQVRLVLKNYKRPRPAPRTKVEIPDLPLPSHHHVGVCSCEPTVAYIRVSSLGQRRRIVSPEIQLGEIVQYAKRNNLRIVRIYFDLKSGRKVEGRQLDKILAEIKAGEYRHISLWKWSRWGRNTKESLGMIHEVQQVGGRVESAETAFNGHSPSDKMMRTFMLAQAEFQSDLIAENWRSAQKLRREGGLPHTGRDRFGYLYRDRRYVVIPGEAETLRGAYQRYVAGASLHQLVREWNAQGLFTMRGGDWTPQSLGKMLDTGFAAGYIRERSNPDPEKSINKLSDYDVWRKGQQDPIIDEELWQAYRARRESLAQLAPRWRKAVHALSALMFCRLCGRRMNTKYMGQKRIHHWVCSHRSAFHPNENISVSNKIAMEVVRAWVRDVVCKEDLRASTRAAEVTEAARAAQLPDASGVDRCMAELANITASKKRLIALAMVAGDDDQTVITEFAEKKRALDNDEREIRIQLARAKAAEEKLNPEVLYPAFVSLDQHWEDLLPSDHRDALAELAGMVLVAPRTSPRLSDSKHRVEVVPAWDMSTWGDAWLSERRRWQESP